MANKYKVTKKDKKFQKDRYELALRYAKSTFIRYFTAALAVISIYWFFLAFLTERKLALIPFAFFVLYVIAMVDQYLTLHSDQKREFKLTQKLITASLLGDIALLVLGYLYMERIFPYLASFTVLLAIIAIAILIKVIIINKIKKTQKQ